MCNLNQAPELAFPTGVEQGVNVLPLTEPSFHPRDGWGAFEEIHLHAHPAHPEAKPAAGARKRTPAGAGEGAGAGDWRPGARTAGPGVGAAPGERERGPGRLGTLRRKLATTCSKGYLYTWRTSTVTPIPARQAPGCAAAAGVHTRPTKGAWEVFSSLFKLSKLYCPPGGTDRR